MAQTLSMTSDIGLEHDPLRRSHSQSMLYLPKISSNIRIQALSSAPSSAPSSPSSPRPFQNSSTYPSYTTTPSSSVSLDRDCLAESNGSPQQDDDDGFVSFPEYSNDYGSELNPHNDDSLVDEEVGEVEKPNFLPSPFSATAICGIMTAPMYHDVHRLSPCIEDDTRLGEEPAGQVDYFSKAWKEEDIWSSWRYVVSKRRTYAIEDGLRFENASWRSWSKSRFNLPEVGQEIINWHGEREVLFLFGPHIAAKQRPLCLKCPPTTPQLSTNASFLSKKTILKKRSVSEAMLQRSLSTCTLMKQATDAVKTQQPIIKFGRGPLYLRTARSGFMVHTDLPSLDTSTTASSTYDASSASTSGSQTPSMHKKHIHFNNKVEQCIAIKPRYCYGRSRRDDSSDDDVLTIKASGKGKSKQKSAPGSSLSEGSKTIAMLPSTTLRGDTPEPPEDRERGSFWSTPSKLSSSASQETIKPIFASGNFLIDDDEEAHLDWEPPIARASGLRSYSAHSKAVIDSSGSNEDNVALRRTGSGMFMPYNDNVDHNDDYGGGIFGRVFNAINTAKDIAHVVWNVGWPR